MSIDHSETVKELNVARFNRIWIGGEWRACKDALPVVDPAMGAQIGTVGQATPQDVDDAVAAARAGFKAWRALSTNKRRECILKLAALVQGNEKELCELESLNMGMPLQVSKSFAIKACYRNLEYFASWMDKIYGEVVPLTGQSEGHFSYNLRDPYGVVAVIIPWNTPMLFLGSKLGPALATGNSVVLKPSELASWTSLRFAELAEQAGFPRGVINVVTGDGSVGGALCEHPGVDKITFTGGGPTARRVMASAAKNLKPVALELGGKSPNIIFKDANMGKATMGSLIGCFALTGQACAAGTRVYVEEPIYETMVNNFKNMLKSLAVGDPLSKGTIIGPLVSKAQLDRVMGFIEGGKKSGAKLIAGGGRKDGKLAEGFFVEPTIFAEADPSCEMAREEIFGPVMNVWPFEKVDEVIEWANNTPYGLAAGVWTSDVNRAHKVARALEAGIVWVNGWGTIPNAAPFGGYKQSGIGREGGHNVLEEFTQVKNVYMELA
ncbi:MAG: aldehyde dehydrogenase [Chrysiogenetes bacterium]|nr:aldehyde dehydrogenase [Chrysiogenetes bacterium]